MGPIRRWSIVVPVKRLELAKTRLDTFPPDLRRALVRAMAADTVAAALACSRVHEVIVVTDDLVAGPELAALGAIVVPDKPDAGLNPALRHGAAVARTRAPGGAVAALSADLPALRTAELDEVLAVADGLEEAFVTDVSGTGTTLYAVSGGRGFLPQFGARSAAAHRKSGAAEVGLGSVASVRRDVDTEVDLRDAHRLGLGVRTAKVVKERLKLG